MEKKSKGFTLLEIIIVLAITLIVMGVVLSMFMTGNRAFADSDVKTDLQIETKNTQENIGEIGMQSKRIVLALPKDQNKEIEKIVFEAYVKDDDEPRYFEVSRIGKKIEVSRFKNFEDKICKNKESSTIIAQDVKSFKINWNGSIENTNSVKFTISLSKKKAFSTVDDYPINFSVNFRNQ